MVYLENGVIVVISTWCVVSEIKNLDVSAFDCNRSESSKY